MNDSTTENATSGNSDEYWRREFQKRIAAIRAPSPHADLRKSPRHEFAMRTLVQVSGPPAPYRILNVSSGGVAILSERKLDPATRLMLSLKGSVFVEIVVIDCTLMERDSTTMDFAYTTRCTFASEQDGYMAFVLLAET